MKLTLERERPLLTCTRGVLLVDGEFFCYTLEDLPQEIKVPGETRIPAGTYQVKITWSPRFKCLMPLLIDVPDFDGVRIHPGNQSSDTAGCILVGETESGEWLGRSRKAYDHLFSKLQDAQFITIEIKDAI